jgi:hypothetical protein
MACRNSAAKISRFRCNPASLAGNDRNRGIEAMIIRGIAPQRCCNKITVDSPEPVPSRALTLHNNFESGFEISKTASLNACASAARARTFF